MSATVLRVAGPGELDAVLLYRICALRVDVFVVEQAAPFAELDGRDLEPATRHLWMEHDGLPLSYLRVLDDGPAGSRIGRLVTAATARGQGLASGLLTQALTSWTRRPTRLAAQAHLEGFYARFGFVADGAPYVEDGIAHLEMVHA